MIELWARGRVWGHIHVFRRMRVWPLMRRNIWNINIYKKNIYKKQIDKQQASVPHYRNTLEHTGTTFHSLFQRCSTTGICRNTSVALVNQGLQRNWLKRCSGMFRLWVPSPFQLKAP